jgi:hypothetical protein
MDQGSGTQKAQNVSTTKVKGILEKQEVLGVEGPQFAIALLFYNYMVHIAVVPSITLSMAGSLQHGAITRLGTV